MLDANGDGKLSKDEIKKHHAKCDKDQCKKDSEQCKKKEGGQCKMSGEKEAPAAKSETKAPAAKSETKANKAKPAK